MNELLDAIRTRGPALSQQVLAIQYRDPFWTQRFGAKGRRHADEDSGFHLQYLVRALVANDPGILVRYARWLREVLATRGMCTRHLAENFRLLAAAIAAEGWPMAERAIEYLRTAESSLAYESGPARDVQAASARVAAAAPAATREELANYLSYIADALALGSPRTLIEHVRWKAAHVRPGAADRPEAPVSYTHLTLPTKRIV